MHSPCSPSYLTLSPEEKARLCSRRATAMQKIRVLSIVMLVSSSIYIIMGILALIFLGSEAVFPFTSGAPIWSGILMLFASYFGLKVSFGDPNLSEDSDFRRIKCQLVAFYSMSVTSISLCGLSFGYSIWGLLYCQNNDICLHNKPAVTATTAIVIILSLVLVTCSILGTVFFCVYKRAFFLHSRQETVDQLQQRIHILDQRLNALQADTGGFKYSQAGDDVAGNQQAPSAPINYQSISDPPPPYTKY